MMFDYSPKKLASTPSIASKNVDKNDDVPDLIDSEMDGNEGFGWNF